MDWAEAIKHLDRCIDAAKTVLGMPGVNMAFYIAIIEGLKIRYEQGERTQELYHAMMDLEV